MTHELACVTYKELRTKYFGLQTEHVKHISHSFTLCQLRQLDKPDRRD